METLPNVLIIELGSQYTLVIERTLREIGFRAVIMEPQKAGKWLKKNPVKAIILSGGAASVYDEHAPEPPDNLFDPNVPVLGICYGMQWLAQHFGGTVTRAKRSEYGPTFILQMSQSPLFSGTGMTQKVWASHGDAVTVIPPGFERLAYTNDSSIQAIGSEERRIYGVQFHPEVTQTEDGKRILTNFLSTISGCPQDWNGEKQIIRIRTALLEGIGEDEKVIMGFSGGVDSTTLAALAAPVLKDRLLCVLIDGGHLRENEVEEIKRNAQAAGVALHIDDARDVFEELMSNVTDAEEKRKNFKKGYVERLLAIAREFGATVILQGTLGPDRIESGATGNSLIKSHHNVGLDFGNLKQAHPIDHLFKHEVRALAADVGLPKSVVNRQPFPGPGLFLRVNGIPATQEKLEIVRWAEARVREILIKHNANEDISQLVVHLLGVKMVGVKGDARSYAYPVVVRAIRTVDFMTAHGVHFAEKIEDEICETLTRHKDIVCVLFNPTDKPPATTEPE